jgi:phage baseplate assembly protein W
VSEEFVGRGWGFPLHTDASGGIALVAGESELEESMRLILGTAYGERPMRPEFGCAVHDYVFDSLDAGMAGRIAYEVRASLRRWESRIDVQEVEVTVEEDAPSVVLIAIRYTTSDTNDPRNLVFPFYTIPERGEGAA